MKEPKTKAELREQLKVSVTKSLATSCKLAKEEATDTPYDWDLTIAEAIEKRTAEFRKSVAQYKAKSQANAKLTSSPKTSLSNGTDSDRA